MVESRTSVLLVSGVAPQRLTRGTSRIASKPPRTKCSHDFLMWKTWSLPTRRLHELVILPDKFVSADYISPAVPVFQREKSGPISGATLKRRSFGRKSGKGFARHRSKRNA